MPISLLSASSIWSMTAGETLSRVAMRWITSGRLSSGRLAMMALACSTDWVESTRARVCGCSRSSRPATTEGCILAMVSSGRASVPETNWRIRLDSRALLPLLAISRLANSWPLTTSPAWLSMAISKSSSTRRRTSSGMCSIPAMVRVTLKISSSLSSRRILAAVSSPRQMSRMAALRRPVSFSAVAMGLVRSD